MSDPLMDHVRRELELAGVGDDDADYDGALAGAVLELMQTFADQHHSGGSAAMVIGMVDKLMRFEPLTPLTGEDHEWMEVGDGLWQNVRCFRVFKNSDGSAHDIDGKVFIKTNGATYTNRDSFTSVTFPYTPNKEFVYVNED